jgi:hypothetical protein
MAAIAHAVVSLVFERYGLPWAVAAAATVRRRWRRPGTRRLYKRLREAEPATV